MLERTLDLNLNEDKKVYILVSDSEIEVRKQFVPMNLNVMATLIDGDLLS